ncbi:MAG: DUF3106 domain-containing protein [Deltaproteobacteria bacterium]|nr:DUF3106 domain-containing protein [Deltaproteobacteria bacterium]
MLKRTVVAWSLAIALVPAMSWAKDDKWGSLSQREKERILQNYQRWNAMPDKDKEQLKEKWNQYQNLPPDQRDQIKQDYENQRRRRGR